MLPPVVTATGRHGQALSTAALRSLNGSYGPGCADRTGTWSAQIDPDADIDHDDLTVVQGNDACQLTLTGLRAGAGDGDLYVADPAIPLGAAYQASRSAFRLDGMGEVRFSGNARLSAVDFDAAFQLLVLVADDANLGSTGHQALPASYADSVLGSGAVAYWRLGETGTTTAASLVGGNGGTYVNGVTLGAPGAVTGDTAASFDGVNDYVLLPRVIQNDFSIEFWFKSSQGYTSGTAWYNAAGMVDAEVGGVVNDFGVSLHADGRVVAGTGNPDTNVTSGAGFNDNAWHQVVFTRQRSTGALRLYIDGSLRTSGTGGTNSLTSPPNIRIGSLRTNIQYFAGSIDEVALYTTVMSAATVLSHYHASGR